MQAVPLFTGWLPQYPAGPVSDDIQTDVVLKLPDSRHSETLHFHICLSLCLTFHTRSMSASQTELYICISVCTQNVIVHRSRLWYTAEVLELIPVSELVVREVHIML